MHRKELNQVHLLFMFCTVWNFSISSKCCRVFKPDQDKGMLGNGCQQGMEWIYMCNLEIIKAQLTIIKYYIVTVLIHCKTPQLVMAMLTSSTILGL